MNHPELMTYQTWRQTHNPWENNFFVGNLDPVSEQPIIENVHNYIDDYFSTRFLGVENPDRFETLFKTKLIAIEHNFFVNLELDNNYYDIKDMLTNHSNTITRATTETVDENSNTDTTDTTKIGEQETTGNINQTSSTTSNTTEKPNSTTTIESSNNGTNTGKTRVLESDMPQSNVSNSTSGLDTPVTWSYASKLTDNLNEGTTTDTGTTTTTNTGTNATDSTSDTDGTTTVSNTTGERTDSSTGTTESTMGRDTTRDENITETGTMGDKAQIELAWRELMSSSVLTFSWLLEQLEPLFYAVW